MLELTHARRVTFFVTLLGVLVLVALHNPLLGYVDHCDQVAETNAAVAGTLGRLSMITSPPLCTGEENWANLVYWKSPWRAIAPLERVGQVLAWIVAVLLAGAAAWVIFPGRRVSPSSAKARTGRL